MKKQALRVFVSLSLVWTGLAFGQHEGHDHDHDGHEHDLGVTIQLEGAGTAEEAWTIYCFLKEGEPVELWMGDVGDGEVTTPLVESILKGDPLTLISQNDETVAFGAYEGNAWVSCKVGHREVFGSEFDRTALKKAYENVKTQGGCGSISLHQSDVVHVCANH